MRYSQPQPDDDQANGQSLVSNAPQQQPKLNYEQIFQLINRTLPFEACLYHQVLPLGLSGNCLTLGVVDPEHTTAVEYVERILSYMNYLLVAQPIDAQTHQSVLSAYLNSTATLQVTEKHSPSRGNPSAHTAKLPEEKTPQLSSNDKPTFILVEREDLTSLKNNQPKAQNPSPVKIVSPSRENKLTKQPNAQATQALPTLLVQASHQSNSVEVLKTLPAKKLLQELLGRVLEKGIGRLYFGRKSPQCSRIVWSQNGNLQCVLPDIPMQVFQELIDELKQLTHLPLVPVKEPLQAEIERFYQKERLLLRLRVMPGKYGEQATLQVLRGEALQFYQQQQLAHLSRDTLPIAEVLQQKLSQLQERAKLNASFHFERYESLMAFNQLLENVEQHLENLKNFPA
jgi:type II secretory ATPase GspE/PulE/Tfp pilus assembly ATPase PilB-like protein